MPHPTDVKKPAITRVSMIYLDDFELLFGAPARNRTTT